MAFLPSSASCAAFLATSISFFGQQCASSGVTVAGADITRIIIQLPSTLTFEAFVDRVCAEMGIHPSTAVLGYKFVGDRVRDPPLRLSSAEEYRDAIEMCMSLMARARTRVVTLEVHSLAPRTAPAPAPKAQKRKGAPSNALVDEKDAPNTTLDFSRELRQVREKYSCGKCRAVCYIDPITNMHTPMDVYQQTLFAKKIFLGQATLDQPPNCTNFDHVNKRPRRNQPHSDNAASQAPTPASQAPTIHVHLPPYPSVTPSSVGHPATSIHHPIERQDTQGRVAEAAEKHNKQERCSEPKDVHVDPSARMGDITQCRDIESPKSLQVRAADKHCCKGSGSSTMVGTTILVQTYTFKSQFPANLIKTFPPTSEGVFSSSGPIERLTNESDWIWVGLRIGPSVFFSVATIVLQAAVM
ncbi:hypothetical protein GSI_00368 [Ganoderma sinense ZZ0214-1]|uniref:Uncharacterized protein n=1 Tax=Ganoderma sinense ZZ0214-1 TaxID=1077348 RepID=A0A2G8SSD2_9APHY|nr:hypothetical protein GSI_00368 [Ganoderma sinense ZZ0214-1]